MERLDALAAIYRLACAVSGVAFPVRFAGTGPCPWTPV